MTNLVQLMTPLILFLPALLSVILALFLWFARPFQEKIIRTLVSLTFGSATVISLFLTFYITAIDNIGQIRIPLGTWFAIDHYRFDWALVLDRLSMPFATLISVLVGLIAVFSHRYLHREPGYGRFFFLLSLFGASMELVVLAGSLDLIFFGWELVGITSAMLIAFFHERKNPVIHGFRAFITYRIGDIGLLGAAIWLHHIVGNSTIANWPGGPWFGLSGVVVGSNATFVGFLLLWSAMAKSAQIPMGGWLPRAMEGPTPSSAIFYGALSIHLGPYLLLRAWPIFAHSQAATFAVMLIGIGTATHASVIGRVQSDIKSALAYASMTQVGVIFVEISLGFHQLALVHIIGHGIIRSLQILRSPSLLHDHRHLSQAMGQLLPRTAGHFERLLPLRIQRWFYRYALERGYLDSFTVDYCAKGLVSFFRYIDKLDIGLAKVLSRPLDRIPMQEKEREVI